MLCLICNLQPKGLHRIVISLRFIAAGELDRIEGNNFNDKAFINYMIVYELTRNEEINHPKSTYINKPAGEDKYRMGIIWDFDWTLGFNYNITNPSHYNMDRVEGSVFENPEMSQKAGAVFFGKIMNDPHMRELFKIRWEEYRREHYDDLICHIIEYANLIRDGAGNDHIRWGLRGSSGDTFSDLHRVITWLDARAAVLDTLYEPLKK